MRLHWEDISREQLGVNGAPYNLSDTRRLIGSSASIREKMDHQVEAQSYYAQNTFYVKDWSFTPGLRVERYRIDKQIYAADGGTVGSDGSYTEINNNPSLGSGLKYSVSQTKALPGFGVAWNGIKNTTVFAGVHRGFSPARPDRDLAAVNNVVLRNNTKAELSTNYEIGARSNYFKGINVESTLFHTAIDDMIVGVQDGAYRNGGKADMSGLELAGRIDFGTVYDTPHNVYLTGSWTNLFNAEFKSDGSLIRDWDETRGNFRSGDRLPYAPRNMGSLNVGYSHPIGVNFQAGADYMGEQLPTPNNFPASTGHSGTIPSFTLLNASGSFKPAGSKTTFFVSGHNLADKEYLSSRVDGMQLGRGRMIFGGITYDF